MSRARPVKTHYKGGRVASSATPHGAAVAAFRRILAGELAADIILDGVVIAEFRAGAFAGPRRVIVRLASSRKFLPLESQ